MERHTRATIILFITLFLVMVGFGIIIPVLPFLLLQFSSSATVLGLLMAVFSIMQFIFAPYWGRLSDRIGRRPVLLIGLSGFGITFIIFGLATDLWMLFIARILSGAISSATLPTAMAYIADITTPENRAKGMGMMGAAMGLGMIFGPALGGWLAHFGLPVPFFVAGGLAVLTVPFAWIFLPESRQASEGLATTETKLNLSIVEHPLFPLFLLSFVVSFSMALFESTFSLFAAEELGFNTGQMGTLFMVMGILGVIMQMSLMEGLVRKYGEIKLILSGIVISAGGLLLILISTDIVTTALYMSIFSIGNSLLRPSISTLISKAAGNEQGASIGVSSSFDSLGRIVGPILGGAVYEWHSSLPNFVGAAILIVVYFVINLRFNPARAR